MSLVQHNGTNNRRPSWNYIGRAKDFSSDICQLEMLESIRNVLEQIRDKQMLQCDVRDDIRAMRHALEQLAAKLERKRRRKKKSGRR